MSLCPSLSRRNVEVLRLAARGLSTDQIARRLLLDPNTVKSHFKQVSRTLGTNGSRTHAVAVAFALGHLRPEDVLDASISGVVPGGPPRK